MIIYTIFAYLVASIPLSEWIFFKHHGERLSDVGTENTGVANIFLFGKKWMGIVSVIWLALIAMGFLLYARIVLAYNNAELSLVLFSMILGNMFPIFNQFKGSKGRTILIWGMLVINFWLLIPMTVVWWAAYILTKKSTVGVIINALLLPFIVYFIEDSIQMTLITVVIGILVLFKNRRDQDDFKELQERSKK